MTNGEKNRTNQEYDMEKEKKPKGFYIEIFGTRLDCHPGNTSAYLYEDQQFDHLFYQTGENEHGLTGYHIWREMLEDGFDNVAKYMIKNGYEVDSLIAPDPTDLEAYYQRYPNKLIKEKELTPRQERLVGFMSYLLNNGHFDPDTFNHQGEIYI